MSDQTREKLHDAERAKVVLEARVTALESMEDILQHERDCSSSLRQELQQQQAETHELKNYNGELQQRIKQLNSKYCTIHLF